MCSDREFSILLHKRMQFKQVWTSLNPDTLRAVWPELKVGKFSTILP